MINSINLDLFLYELGKLRCLRADPKGLLPGSGLGSISGKFAKNRTFIDFEEITSTGGIKGVLSDGTFYFNFRAFFDR